jgi:lysophospholipase L1-like esterase
LIFLADSANSAVSSRVRVPGYVIDELVAANLIPVTPPDFHAWFATHYTTEYADSLHPNGIGYQSMANLWLGVLAQ